MKYVVAVMLLLASSASYGANQTAQDVANENASARRLRHIGGNGGMLEGIGTGSSPTAALRNCCFWGRIRIHDQGVAMSRDGRWFACIRGR